MRRYTKVSIWRIEIAVMGAFLSLLPFPSSLSYATDLIRPKVLVLATYETGKDQGDIPGELQFWVERERLDQAIQVPGIDHPILTNGQGLYAMIIGTTSRCSAQIMTLAMDPRFDLRKTYLLLGGIAGGNPAQVTVGSAVWIRNVVDGDLAYEIDSREVPAAWPYGLIAFGATEPGKAPANLDSSPTGGLSEEAVGGPGRIVYRVNPTLVNWAYGLTKDLKLPDNNELAANRAPFKGYPNALKNPTVVEGDSVASSRFWTGTVMTRWAEDWDRIYTKGRGALAIGDGEDQGLFLAVEQLNKLGRVDAKRLLILRTVSNFTMPPPGVRADKSLFDDLARSPGYLPALEADYRVASVVVHSLLEHWEQYEEQLP